MICCISYGPYVQLQTVLGEKQAKITPQYHLHIFKLGVDETGVIPASKLAINRY